MEKVRFSIICVILSIVSITYANVIEINSNITTNQIWTATNTYHVTAGVNVTALLVIEPGTNISFGSSGGLIVNNGGTLISAGTPNNRINYTSDANSGWGDYNCAIEIQETASPATKIIYNYIKCANIAILTKNIQLDTPIQNNILFYNNSGIKEYGTHHTDILNNLIYYGYNSNYYSYCISIYMESTTGGADANSSILIENNTCDYQDYGIVVRGTANINNMAKAKLINNIVSESAEYGICVINGYISETVSNTGYYDNYINQYGYDSARESNTVVTTVNPFDATGWHLVNGCPFINAGKEYIEQTPLIGMTTNVNGTPDSNKIDIGYHYPNWNYSNAGSTTLHADFDNNLKVDYKDLRFFANYWLFDYNEAYQTWSWDYDNSGKVDMNDLRVVSEYWLSPFDFFDFADFANQWQKKVDERYYDSRADLNNDKIVNFKDFAILANEWRKTAQGNPAISVSVIGDANNLNGEVGVSVTGCRNSTSEVSFFMDGQFIGKTLYEQGETPGMNINTPSYRNGSHSFKAVAIDHNSIILSGTLAVNFNNPVHCLNIEDTYESNTSLRLLGFSATGNNLQVKLTKWDGTTIWSQATAGNLDLTIPGSVLAGQIYDVSIEQEISGLALLDRRLSDLNSPDFVLLDSSLSWEPIWEKAIAAKYNLNDSYKFAIFLPTAWNYIPIPEDAAKSRKKAVAGIVNLCDLMGIKYIILYKDQCTWENFSKVLKQPSLIYVYLTSRGNYELGGATSERTNFWVTDGYVVSNLDAPLGGGWDGKSNVHSMASVGLGGSHQLKMVWIDVCYNGKYDDMARAWMTGLDEPGAKQLYVSWNPTIDASNESCFCDWTAFFFGYPDPDSGFGHHGDNDYSEALEDAQRGGHVCNINQIVPRVVYFGDTSIKFTPNRYDY